MTIDSRLPTSSQQEPYHITESSSSSSSKTIATSIDAFVVYEEAVQTPLIEANNLSSLYYNAQDFGSKRPYAKVLREDFSSTGAVATTWLTLDAEHRSQAVDIDFDALKIAQRRLVRGGAGGKGLRHPLGEQWNARLLQHEEFHQQGQGSRWIEDDGLADEDAKMNILHQQDSSTWSEGAASDRFERKFQAKQAKLRAKHHQAKQRERTKAQGQQQPHNSLACQPGNGQNGERGELQDDVHLLLLHSSVLSLPIVPPPSSARNIFTIDPPDIVASLNYALSYFHKRRDLISYLLSVRNSLRRGTGVLISDQFAGPMGEQAREGYGEGRELSAEEEEKEQDSLWSRFASEEGAKGFLRRGETLETLPTKLSAENAGVQVWRPIVRCEDKGGQEEPKQVHSQDGASASQWPRGRLSLVRRGKVPHRVITEGRVEEKMVDFEYWREDTPVDIKTNRFRMSLSFRFPADGSWVRDYFSYDFRFWTLREVLEAIEEVGFVDVRTEVLDRGAVEEMERREVEAEAKTKVALALQDQGQTMECGIGTSPEGRQVQENLDEDQDQDGEEEGGLAALLLKTEREASVSLPAVTYKVLEEGDKVFARRSFGTYIVAKAPP